MGGVGVGVGAFAGSAVLGTGGREDVAGGVAEVHGAGPAAADADVVEVRGAVGVGLGPFAAESWSESIGWISSAIPTRIGSSLSETV